MILTGSYIKKEIEAKNILVSPFSESQLNPNSYNYRLGDKLKIFTSFESGKSYFEEMTIPQDGFVLEPHKLYLGHTFERLGSKKYAMSLIGRSSIGRLGLFVQISANLGHTHSSHQWTLELVAVKQIRIYPRMTIGQISFWENCGEVIPYHGTYGGYDTPQEAVF